MRATVGGLGSPSWGERPMSRLPGGGERNQGAQLWDAWRATHFTTAEIRQRAARCGEQPTCVCVRLDTCARSQESHSTYAGQSLCAVLFKHSLCGPQTS